MTTKAQPFEPGDHVWLNTKGLRRFRPVRRWEIVATVLGWRDPEHLRIRWDTQDQPETVGAQFFIHFKPEFINHENFNRRFLLSRMERYR